MVHCGQDWNVYIEKKAVWLNEYDLIIFIERKLSVKIYKNKSNDLLMPSFCNSVFEGSI